jgi:vancomycin aglycone glucosyltransferase
MLRLRCRRFSRRRCGGVKRARGDDDATAMRIAIAVEGTRGDVHPMLALGARLAERGHDVRVCAPPDFAGDAAERGLAFHAVGASVREYLESQSDFLHGSPWASLRAAERYFQASIARQFDDMRAALKQADWLFSAGVQLAAPSLAEACGARHRFIAYCPSLLRSPLQTPFVVPRGSLRPWQNKLAWWFTIKLFSRLRPALDRERARLGLPPSRRDLYELFRGERVLLAAEELLAQAPPDLRDEVPVIGCLHPFEDAPLPEKLDAFLRRGAPPVYFGFGSMTDPDPAASTRLVLETAERAGVRAVISSGWAGLGVGALPETVHVTGPVAHSALFRRVAAVIHHGGAGTTTTAARAGAPQLLVPHILDQYHWAERIHRLGLGPPALPRRRLDAQKLADTLRATLDNELVAQRADELGAQLRAAAAARAHPGDAVLT